MNSGKNYAQIKKSLVLLFLIPPFDGRIKSKILHLSQKSENRTDEEIKDAIQRIAEEGLKNNIHFIYVSTYSQSGNNEAHCNFGKFIDSISIDNFDEILLNVPKYNCLIQLSD